MTERVVQHLFAGCGRQRRRSRAAQEIVGDVEVRRRVVVTEQEGQGSLRLSEGVFSDVGCLVGLQLLHFRTGHVGLGDGAGRIALGHEVESVRRQPLR